MTKTKRILFVDDEPMVLRGLQRMLRSLRTDWDMEFVQSGPEALARMAQAPVDVVVSDMRMPGMNGAELLDEVRKRAPATIRLILSGHADKELILKCVGSTHQYLAKPCDPDSLRATLLRTAAAEASMANAQLKQLVARMEQIPSIPAIYSEMVELLRDPDATLESVGQLIARDIGMTANILKLVNSAFFGLRRQITTPAEAAAYLGLETIKALVLSLHAFKQFDPVDITGFSIPALWDHSLAVAKTARAIAEAEPGNANWRDEALVAGLLHDAGKVVLAANFSREYAEVVRLAGDRNLELFLAEEQIFGANHADVGGYLFGLWGLPVPVVETIALHHHPARSLNRTFGPLIAVHVADTLVHAATPHSTIPMPTLVDLNHLTELGLAERLPAWKQRVVAT